MTLAAHITKQLVPSSVLFVPLFHSVLSGIIMMPISQMWKLKLRSKQLAQGRRACKQWIPDSDPHLSHSRPTRWSMRGRGLDPVLCSAASRELVLQWVLSRGC